jgi:acetyl-CoA carboxylase biotin carboxyl carrier protein
VGLTDEDVREILRIIDESDLDELRIETPDFRLHVRRGGAPPLPAEPAEPAEAPGRPRAATPEARDPGAEAAPPAAPAPDASVNGAATIEAPMLGTFYRASAPGEDPFVDVGSDVEPDTVVCLIEVMKMMNSVKAGVAGRVVEVCARNAELVEYGEPLFRVDPAA